MSVLSFLRRSEGALAAAVMATLVLVPLLESGLRSVFGFGIPGSAPIVQHLTLWVAFLGAALAAREGKLLSLATSELVSQAGWRRAAGILSGTVGAAVSALLARGALDLLLIERQAGTEVAGLFPVWLAQAVLPLGLTLVAVRLVWRADEAWWGRAVAAAGLGAGVVVGWFPMSLAEVPVWPGLVLLLLATVAGGPIFVALGGAAVLLFMAEGVPPAAVPAETYRLSVSATLPAIPLFTLTGFLLAEGGVSERLLRVFRAWIGWLPGGTAVVTALLCAFFTVFTGGSGVTILALGGLLLPTLLADGYRDRFSVGLLTASGSLGLLFPPALPIILYGIVASIAIEDLFVGGILPGFLLVGLVAAWGLREGWKTRTAKRPFEMREALAALWGAKWELALPVVVLVAIFGGFATLVEAAAMTALYAFLVGTVIHRDVPLKRLTRVLVECSVLVGGVLIILGMAMGFTSWLVDAQVPSRLLEWVQATVSSPLLFLLGLNLFLLLVGCLMDIFSAIVVVVPLIVPLGVAYGIDPVHLGIIFIANLELGYLTPPVGLNLFLASYRFERPLLHVYRAALPFLAILAIGVLLITYVPAFTTFLPSLLGR